MENVKNKILNYLKQGGHLTPLKALNLFNCLSLSQRITELRNEGYAVQSKLIKTETGKHVSEYWLND